MGGGGEVMEREREGGLHRGSPQDGMSWLEGGERVDGVYGMALRF